MRSGTGGTSLPSRSIMSSASSWGARTKRGMVSPSLSSSSSSSPSSLASLPASMRPAVSLGTGGASFGDAARTCTASCGSAVTTTTIWSAFGASSSAVDGALGPVESAGAFDSGTGGCGAPGGGGSASAATSMFATINGVASACGCTSGTGSEGDALAASNEVTTGGTVISSSSTSSSSCSSVRASVPSIVLRQRLPMTRSKNPATPPVPRWSRARPDATSV